MPTHVLSSQVTGAWLQLHCQLQTAAQAYMYLLQGVDGWDVDLPTMFEANLVTNTLMKVAWVFVYLGVYGLRPVIIRPKPNSASTAISAFLPDYHTRFTILEMLFPPAISICLTLRSVLPHVQARAVLCTIIQVVGSCLGAPVPAGG